MIAVTVKSKGKRTRVLALSEPTAPNPDFLPFEKVKNGITSKVFKRTPRKEYPEENDLTHAIKIITPMTPVNGKSKHHQYCAQGIFIYSGSKQPEAREDKPVVLYSEHDYSLKRNDVIRITTPAEFGIERLETKIRIHLVNSAEEIFDNHCAVFWNEAVNDN